MTKTCEIRYVKQKTATGWKWCYVKADGSVKESTETYALFYECAVAAKQSGYDPQLKCA